MANIRLATPADAAALCALNREFNGREAASLQEIEAFLAGDHTEIICVAEQDGTLHGFCCGQIVRSFCYAAPTGEITELFVRRDSRRAGIGRQLMRFMEDALRGGGVTDFYLKVTDDNDEAMALYASMGYHDDEEPVFHKPADEVTE